MKQRPIVYLEKDGRKYRLISSRKAEDLMVLENERGDQFETHISKAKGYIVTTIEQPDLPDEPEKSLGRNERARRLRVIKKEFEHVLERLYAIKGEVESLSKGDASRLELAIKRFENWMGE